MQLASDFCGGLPLSNFAGGEEIEWSEALTTDSVFKVAVASYDSGLAIATGTTGEPLRLNRALRIGKARSLVALRRFAEAATLVADIPTDYAYEHTFSASTGDNALWGQPADSRRYNVGNNFEGNARDIPVANNLNFFSANDPRVPAGYEITRSGTRVDTTRSQDGNTLSRTTTIWAQETPVAIFNGTDARLIEAEAAYQRQDYAEMMRILNGLRANPPANGDVRPDPMPALTDPGTDQARVDLLFREKAFWTFGRGQRLGDLRRLLRDPYRRAPENTFPTGTHYRGGSYGTAIAMPIPQEEENNPLYERAACTQ
jgi:hypothetical protein